MNFGEKDGGSPIEFVREGVKTIANVYASMHAEKNFSYFIEEGVGHVLSDAMWQRTKDWFKQHLRS